MRIRTIVGAVLGTFLFLVSAKPAAAQGVDVAAGYQFMRWLDFGGENLPAGWGVSFAGGKSDMVKVVADLGGNYEDGFSLHTFQGGVEFVGKNPRVAPFVRVLAGLGLFAGDGDGPSETAFVFTPEFGVKIMGSGRVGAQVAVGFPIFHFDRETLKTMRLFVGIVYRGK